MYPLYLISVLVMPHASEPERLQRNLATMTEIKAMTLSEYRGLAKESAEPMNFPAVGSEFEIYADSFLEMMQFVFNHTTFDPEDAMDQAVLAAMRPLGVEPGKEFDPDAATAFAGSRFEEIARRVASEQMALATRPEGNPYVNDMFQPKGQITLEVMLLQSVLGPIGLPAHQALYPAITTSDGTPMNAQYDYVLRMSQEYLRT